MTSSRPACSYCPRKSSVLLRRTRREGWCCSTCFQSRQKTARSAA